MSDNNKTPDWDKITEGKIRHGIAVEAFAKGMDLDAQNMKLIEKRQKKQLRNSAKSCWPILLQKNTKSFKRAKYSFSATQET